MRMRVHKSREHESSLVYQCHNYIIVSAMMLYGKYLKGIFVASKYLPEIFCLVQAPQRNYHSPKARAIVAHHRSESDTDDR